MTTGPVTPEDFMTQASAAIAAARMDGGIVAMTFEQIGSIGHGKVELAVGASTQTAFTRHQFTNRVRSLYNIDLFVIRRELPDMTDRQWDAFMRDPPRYLISADQPTAEAIWRCVEARQPGSGEAGRSAL